MKPLPILRRLAALSAAALLGTTLAHAGPVEKHSAKDAAVIAEPHPMYLGTINSGIKGNDSYIDGNFSIVAPIWSTLGADSTLSGGVLFLEPYISYGEGGEVATSLGVGYRYLFGSQPVSAFSRHDGHQAGFLEEGVFVGANVFLDMLDTEANNQFWQLGVGLEIGSRYLELRGNYYIPLSDKQLAEEFRTRETRTSSRTTTSQQVAPAGDPYATGYSVAQDALFTTVASTSISTTTIERLFRRYEEGMEGWDAEVAVLLPWIDKYMDVKVIGGYYSFDNQPFGPQEGGTGNVKGFKAGLEVRPVPAIILNGTWYEDERLTGGDWTVGAQMQIPFEGGDLGDGGSFWSRIGDAFHPRRRHLAERIAEPVRRQNAAVKIAGSVEEEKSRSTTTTSVQKVTRVVERRPGQLVIAEDIIFVNNGGPVGNGIQAGTTQAAGANGTAEHPFNTLTEGSIAGGTMSNMSARVWNVYTQGNTGTDYTDNAVVVGSTNFISSQSHIFGVNGLAFGGNTARPVVIGGISAENVAYVGVTGYAFKTGLSGPWWSGKDGAGIYAKNIGELVVDGNTFSELKRGVVVETTGSFTGRAFINANQFSDAYTGVRLHSHNASLLLAQVTNNQFNGNLGRAVYGASHGTSTLEANILANKLVGDNDDGIHLESFHGSKLLADVTDNVFDGSFNGSAVELASHHGSELVANVTGSLMTGDFERGILARSSGWSKLKTIIAGNLLEGGFEDGIKLESLHGSKLIATIEDNELDGDFDDSGIDLDSAHGSKLFVGVRNNELKGDYRHAVIELDSKDGSLTWATIESNTLLADADVGIDVTKHDDARLYAFVKDNTIGDFRSDFDEAGLRLTSYGSDDDGSKLKAYVSGNTLRGEYNNSGIVAKSYHGSDLYATIVHNSLRGEFNNAGIELESYHGSDLRAYVGSNSLRGEFDDAGIEVQSHDGSDLNATLKYNFLTGEFNNDGIKIEGEDSSDLRAYVQSNFLTGDFDDYGIRIKSSDYADVYTSIKYNVLSGDFGDSGVLAVKEDRSDLDVYIERNWLSGDFGDSGVELKSYDSDYRSKMYALVSGNTFSGDFGRDGVSVDSYDESELETRISGNVFKGFFDDAGIDVRKHDKSELDISIVYNSLQRDDWRYHDNYDVGIRLTAEDSSSSHSKLDAFVGGNTLSGDFDTGIEINAEDYAELEAKVFFNKLTGTFDIGIDVNRDDRSEVDVDISKNWLDGDFDDYGIRVTGDGSSTGETKVVIDGNTLSGDFDGDGIYVRSKDYARVDAWVKNNKLWGHFDDTGIKFQTSDRSDLDVYHFSNNWITGHTDRGVWLIESRYSSLSVDGNYNNKVWHSHDNFDADGHPSFDFYLNGYHLQD